MMAGLEMFDASGTIDLSKVEDTISIHKFAHDVALYGNSFAIDVLSDEHYNALMECIKKRVIRAVNAFCHAYGHYYDGEL